MCDEMDDVFADEPKVPVEALREWNLKQDAWKPFKRWQDLEQDERMEVWRLYDQSPAVPR